MRDTKFYFLTLVCLTLAFSAVGAQRDSVDVRIAFGSSDDYLKAKMESNASTLLTILKNAAHDKKEPKFPDNIMTEDTEMKIKEMWKSSRIECIYNEIRTNCLNTSYGDLQIRNIPVIFTAASEETKNEEISLNFNKQGLINDINITIKLHQYESIFGNSEVVEDIVNRNKILDFIEKFRTAYNCKDIEYLENVYSNNALIINAVERKIRQIPNSDQPLKSLGEKQYDFQVKSKAEYIAALKKVFKKNSFINIIFDSIEVLEHPGFENIYGVTLKQHWNSESYNDVGYLYLLIDCTKEYEMQVFVRAWSPDQLFDFNSFGDIKFHDSK
ncbi:MAG: hypothetical protein LBR84_00095 [Tannerella sp.]|nr:hypothetical protein [Tannerella sp.]